MSKLRTKETSKKLKEWKVNRSAAEPCFLCTSGYLKEFNHWKIVENRFPYDSIAELAHIFTPKRHVLVSELNTEELDELRMVKQDYIKNNYDFIIEVVNKQTMSVPDHYHMHLIVEKE